MRLYACPAHWDGGWQDIHLKVWSETYEATNLKYEICGDYNGGNQNTMFQLRLKDAGGSSEHGRFRLVLGTPVDAGWDHSGQNTYYVDVYAEVSHYMNFTVAADFYSAGFNVNTLPTSGGATSVVYSSPVVSNITTFNEAKEHSYFANHKIWNDGNHGSASGLDADLLDGQHGSYYYPASNPNGYTNDQTAAEILTAIKTVDGSGSGLDADLLDGQHGSYYATASHGHTGLAVSSWGGIKSSTSSGYIEFGPANTTWAHIYTDRPNFYFNKNLYVLGSKVWHVGNDGSGSGLDADTVDGVQAASMVQLTATQTITGQKYFRSDRNTTSNSPPLQAYSSGGGGAIMSFHRGGYYAINFGLDSDNVIRMGGWSAATNRFQMDMAGNLTMAGNITAYSDIRLKENIKAIPDALSKVQQLRGVTFTRNDTEDLEKLHTGVIAQEVEAVLPEAVSEDNDGIKNVAYGNMVGLLIESIKELKAEVDDLKTQLENK